MGTNQAQLLSNNLIPSTLREVKGFEDPIRVYRVELKPGEVISADKYVEVDVCKKETILEVAQKNIRGIDSTFCSNDSTCPITVLLKAPRQRAFGSRDLL